MRSESLQPCTAPYYLVGTHWLRSAVTAYPDAQRRTTQDPRMQDTSATPGIAVQSTPCGDRESKGVMHPPPVNNNVNLVNTTGHSPAIHESKYSQLSSSCLVSTQSHGSLTWPLCSKIPQGVNPRGHILRRFATLSDADAARRSGTIATELGQEDAHWPLHTTFGDSQTHWRASVETEKPLLHVYPQGLLDSQTGMAPSGYWQVDPTLSICYTRVGRMPQYQREVAGHSEEHRLTMSSRAVVTAAVPAIFTACG